LMTLYIQAFRYAAEPFFFSQSDRSDARQTYAYVLKYFTVIGLGVFLVIALGIDIFKHFIGVKYHAGLFVVPILLLANLLLGIYYNLSIWYKLTNNTIKGAVMAIIGALITVILNWWLIPIIGYKGSAWATLICYLSMVVMSYYWGKKHYPIPYDISFIMRYVLLAVALFVIDQLAGGYFVAWPHVAHYLFKSLLLIIFIGVLGWEEREKIALLKSKI